MKTKKQILLPSKDIISRGQQDLYVELDLNSSSTIIKSEKINNDFDVLKQFNDERNSSRNFSIYGIVDSNVVDSSNILVEMRDEHMGFISSAITTSLALNQVNIFGKSRGKYFFDLSNFSGTSINLLVKSDGQNYEDIITSRQLVFSDSSGELVPYGTETLDFGFDGNFSELNNNFPFFYNKHWIKQDITIPALIPASVRFGLNSYELSEGEETLVSIELSRPSILGIESLDLISFSATLSTNDYISSASTSLSWSIGEQVKTFSFNALPDSINELTESIFYRLENLLNILPSNEMATVINVKDSTQRKYVSYHIPYVHQNRTPFTGQTVTNQQFSVQVPHPSILRNGHFYDKRNEEFYPVDKYSIEIKNEGIDTIIPVDNGVIQILSEQTWAAGEIKTFSIIQSYDSQNLEEILFTFKYANEVDRFLANGLMYRLSIDGVNSLVGSAEFFDSKLTQWETIFEKPFTHTVSGNNVFVRSTCPGHPLNLFFGSSEFNGQYLSVVLTAQTLSQFQPANQIEKVITLCANSADGNSCEYSFNFVKNHYSSVFIGSSQITAGVTPSNAFLNSTYSDVATQFNKNFGTFGFLECISKNDPNPLGSSTSEVTVNGFVFMSSNPYQRSELSSANWSSGQVNTIPCTSSDLSVANRVKVAVLNVDPQTPLPKTWSVKIDPNNSGNYISFSLTTTNPSLLSIRNNLFNRMYGTTPQFRQTTAFAMNNPVAGPSFVFPKKSRVYAYTPSLSQVGNATSAYYHYATPTAETIILSGSSNLIDFGVRGNIGISYTVFQEREVIGVTQNPHNNKMGGFNTKVVGGPNNGLFVVPI